MSDSLYSLVHRVHNAVLHVVDEEWMADCLSDDGKWQQAGDPSRGRSMTKLEAIAGQRAILISNLMVFCLSVLCAPLLLSGRAPPEHPRQTLTHAC